MKSLQDLSGRPNLEASGWVPKLEDTGPDQPRSYPSARIRPQILEVRAVNGLQGLQLVVLSLRIALLLLGPAASRGPAAPSHGGRGKGSGLGEVAVVLRRAVALSRRLDRAGGGASSRRRLWGRSLEPDSGLGAWLCAGVAL